MTKKQAIQLFQERKERTLWDDKAEKWYFAIVDVVGILTDSANPQIYWRVLKNRLKKGEMKPLQIVTLLCTTTQTQAVNRPKWKRGLMARESI